MSPCQCCSWSCIIFHPHSHQSAMCPPGVWAVPVLSHCAAFLQNSRGQQLWEGNYVTEGFGTYFPMGCHQVSILQHMLSCTDQAQNPCTPVWLLLFQNCDSVPIKQPRIGTDSDLRHVNVLWAQSALSLNPRMVILLHQSFRTETDRSCSSNSYRC